MNYIPFQKCLIKNSNSDDDDKSGGLKNRSVNVDYGKWETAMKP